MMRAAVIAVLTLLACSRRVDHNVRPIETPSARGGGPPAMTVAGDARRRIADARCALREACGGSDSPDACRARVEADTKIDCAVDPSRVDACVEAIRARTCTDSTAPVECAHVCPSPGKENGQ
jgi:hypothetical protein